MHYDYDRRPRALAASLSTHENFVLNRLYNGQKLKLYMPGRKGNAFDKGTLQAARALALKGWINATPPKQEGPQKVTTLTLTEVGRRAYKEIAGLG